MDLVSKAVEIMSEKLEAHREKIIFDRLKRHGIELDMELEKVRRFKSLSVVYDIGGSETIYYNDGSKNGLRIVTFTPNIFPFDFETMSLKMESNYY